MKARRGTLLVLFTIYLVLLAWAVLWKLDVPYVGETASPTITFVPFVPTAESGGSEPLEVVANVALFIPFGLYLGVLAPRWRWWQAALTAAGASLVLEAAQYLLRVGIPDVSDLVANTAGGLAGIGLARLWQVEQVSAVATRVFAVTTGLVVIAVLAFIASPVHYAPPRDVLPLHCDPRAARTPTLIGCGP